MRRRLLCITFYWLTAVSAPMTFASTQISTATSSTAPTTAAGPIAAQAITTQLPRSVVPVHYDVDLIPDAAHGRFAASATIEIDVLTPTRAITFNAAGLAIRQARLTDAQTHRSVASTRIDTNAGQETVTVNFARVLPAGRYRLALDYRGEIGTQAAGLFSLDYQSAHGARRALFTQFENSDARRMIPCWDEPAYKATFTLSATVPAADLAISNMPVRAVTARAHAKKRVEFATTPKMSSYLLFFASGDLERATTHSGATELGVVTQRGLTGQAALVLDASATILQHYNEYFGVAYPLPKLDNIAAPGRSEFFGAMENWGAIFTFEHAMLLDPAISTQNDKQGVFSTAAHEMAHQWFGDLVTMQWWDDLWLNEGFASWMESRTTARLHPEWQTVVDTVAGRERAMSLDALSTTHPVVQHVDTVAQASQAFDAITYQKGEAVIRMLEDFVGEDAWRDGVRAYLKKHAYGNTTSDDLWKEVDRTAGKPVSAIAHDFTLQPGIPMVRVERAVCRDNETTLTLSQAEFSQDQADKTALRWRTPVRAQIGAEGAPVHGLIDGAPLELKLPGCGPVLVNAGQTGYYRTLYSAQTFQTLAQQFNRLAPIDQLGMLDNTLAMGLSGHQPVADFLNLADAIGSDATPKVWQDLAYSLVTLHRLYQTDPARQQRFDRYAIARLTPVMTRTGWQAQPGETDAVGPLREQLISALSEFNDTATVAEARRRYNAQASDSSAVPPALRDSIMTVVARHADDTTWEALRAKARSENSPLIKERMYRALAAVENVPLAERVLEMALRDEVPVTLSASLIQQVADQHPGLAVDFALAHLAQVEQRVGPSSQTRYVASLGALSSDPTMIDKLDAYAQAHLPVDARREEKIAVKQIAQRIRTQAERLPQIDDWLRRHEG